MIPVQNAQTTDLPVYQKILVAGKTGSGKTSQIWTLPGRKFAYLFDPAAMSSLKGCDVDTVSFMPEALELDATLKGFNKGTKDDKLASTREPRTYMNWVDDLNKRADSGFFKQYDWLCFDSLTFLANAVMDRQLFINGRYGAIEDLADYRIVGSKIAEVFRSVISMPINIYCTGHVDSFQDEKTKRIEYQLRLPGRSRSILPLMFSNIWLAQGSTEGAQSYSIRTRPEPRGFQDIRTTIRGLKDIEDVTIKSFSSNAQNEGIGKILRTAGFKTLPKAA